MNATVAKPKASYRLSLTELRERWRQLAGDPLVAAIPFKVELNEKGAIEVSPPTTRHAFLQAYMSRELAPQRPDGTTFTGCPVETEIGMRIPDVVWASPEFMRLHGTESEFRAGPDLCVEVLSPTNTRAEIDEKIAANLAAGAREVWVVGADGGAGDPHHGRPSSGEHSRVRLATSAQGLIAARRARTFCVDAAQLRVLA